MKKRKCMNCRRLLAGDLVAALLVLSTLHRLQAASYRVYI